MEKNNVGFGKQITFLIVAVSILVFVCAVSIAVVKIRTSLTTSAEQKISEITEMSSTILDGYKQRVDSGEITEAQAKKLALAEFKNIRYQGKNYIWIMDYDSKYLCHPTRAVGFDGSTLKDKDGNQYIKQITDSAVQGKLTFVKNFATKPGDASKKIYPKISTARAFPQWHWVVATGIYIDEIDKMVFDTFLFIAFTTIFAVFIIVILANQCFIKKLVNKLNIISSELRQTSNQVADASGILESSSHKLAEGSVEQASAIQETSATVEETSSMVQQNNENTKHAAILAKNTKKYTTESAVATQKMMTTMENLEHSSNEISKIIKAIDDIAFQTNILSLNAAVEAARAGDAGKGFAVVAEEVRTLAQRSAQAAKNTESIIVENISLSKQGVEMAKDVECSLAQINEEVQKVDEILEEISTATNEQAQGVDQINKAMSQMEIVIQSNADTANSNASASQELSSQVNSMNDMVDNLYVIVNGSKNI